jgi:hypothetical protein
LLNRQKSQYKQSPCAKQGGILLAWLIRASGQSNPILSDDSKFAEFQGYSQEALDLSEIPFGWLRFGLDGSGELEHR